MSFQSWCFCLDFYLYAQCLHPQFCIGRSQSYLCMCCPDVSTSHPECCPSTLWWATNGSLARPRPPGDALSVDATQRSSHSFDFAIAPIGDNENSGCDAGSPHSYRHFDSQEYVCCFWTSTNYQRTPPLDRILAGGC